MYHAKENAPWRMKPIHLPSYKFCEIDTFLSIALGYKNPQISDLKKALRRDDKERRRVKMPQNSATFAKKKQNVVRAAAPKGAVRGMKARASFASCVTDYLDDLRKFQAESRKVTVIAK